MLYNRFMSETNFELYSDGIDALCCDTCTCENAHSSTPRP